MPEHEVPQSLVIFGSKSSLKELLKKQGAKSWSSSGLVGRRG